MNFKKETLRLSTIVLLGFNAIYSQSKIESDADRFTKSEIILNDGSKIEGYIASFLETPKSIDYDDAWYSSAEKNYNLTDKEFEFRTALEDRSKIYKQRDVKEVTLFYGNTIKPKTYRVLELKYLDDNGELNKSSKSVWLPIIKDDKVSIYSVVFWYRKQKAFNEFKYSKKRRKMLTMTYLGNSQDNYVLSLANPFDDDLSRIFNHKKITANVLRHIFKDCPNFTDKIITKDKFNKDLYSVDKSSFKEKIEQTKDNTSLSDGEKDLIIDEITTEMDNQSFVKLIDDYKTFCN